MPDITAQVRIPSVSGLPEDAVINTWHFMTGEPDLTASEAADIAEALGKFYNLDPSPSAAEISPVASFLGSSLSRAANAVEVRFYDKGDAEPRPLLQTIPFTLSAPGGTSDLPRDVACTLSYRADFAGVAEEVEFPPDGPEGNTRPRQRRRGRVFIGPLRNHVVDGSTGRPTLAFRQSLIFAAEQLVISLAAETSTIDWVVWSETDLMGREVVEAWCDDEFDTMRSRGLKRTVRTATPINQ